MSGREVATAPLTGAAFAPFGEVIEAAGEPSYFINAGRCGRFHDLADVDVVEGKAGISLFRSACVTLPYALDLMERHPRGSQAFLPIGEARALVVVAPDEGGRPGTPLAFVSARGQGFNIARNVWHGVLAPLAGGDFFVIDRIGPGENLELHPFEEPFIVR